MPTVAPLIATIVEAVAAAASAAGSIYAATQAGKGAKGGVSLPTAPTGPTPSDLASSGVVSNLNPSAVTPSWQGGLGSSPTGPGIGGGGSAITTPIGGPQRTSSMGGSEGGLGTQADSMVAAIQSALGQG